MQKYDHRIIWHCPCNAKKEKQSNYKESSPYYHFGNAQFRDGSKVTSQIQSKMVGALQGKKKGARILDPDAVKQQQAGSLVDEIGLEGTKTLMASGNLVSNDEDYMAINQDMTTSIW